MGTPPMLAWKVYPKIGLKGFSMINSRGKTESVKATTAFIWILTSESATGFKYLGAHPKDAALLSRSDLD